MPILETILFTVLTLVLPALGIRDMRRLRRAVAAGDTDARLRAYRETFWMQWILAIGFGVWWVLRGDSLSSAGLALGYASGEWIGVAFALAAASFLLAQMAWLSRRPEQLEGLADAAGDARIVIPRTDRENKWFDAVSITAGVCEEFLYRGLLLTALMTTVGTWGAIVLSSVVFGLGHVYQGPKGAVRTAGVGLVMAGLTVASGSIYAAVLVHMVIDLTSGRLLRQALEAEKDPQIVTGEV